MASPTRFSSSYCSSSSFPLHLQSESSEQSRSRRETLRVQSHGRESAACVYLRALVTVREGYATRRDATRRAEQSTEQLRKLTYDPTRADQSASASASGSHSRLARSSDMTRRDDCAPRHVFRVPRVHLLLTCHVPILATNHCAGTWHWGGLGVFRTSLKDRVHCSDGQHEGRRGETRAAFAF